MGPEANRELRFFSVTVNIRLTTVLQKGYVWVLNKIRKYPGYVWVENKIRKYESAVQKIDNITSFVMRCLGLFDDFNE